MKNAIRYYYQLEVTNLDFNDHRYYFDSFILVELQKPFDLSIYQFLLDNQYPVYQIIPNKDQSYVTRIDEKDYVLLSAMERRSVHFETLENFQIFVYQEEILPWHELWMNKVDYYEKHIQTVTSQKLKESFFYYIGMSENAISFYQLIKKKQPLYLSHYRMENDFDYWNPTNFAIDYRARDIAEYCKRLFFEGNLNISDLYLYFSRTQFGEQDYLLFYARMLYPSYYFDCYDRIVHGESEDCLDVYLNKVELYENFLRELYYSFSRIVFLPKIDWIIDK